MARSDAQGARYSLLVEKNAAIEEVVSLSSSFLKLKKKVAKEGVVSLHFSSSFCPGVKEHPDSYMSFGDLHPIFTSSF